MTRMLGIPRVVRAALGAAALAAGCARSGGVHPLPDARATRPARLEAGAAALDLTPPRPVPLAGYGARHGKRFTAVLDRPQARVLALRNGDVTIAIASADLLVVPASLREAVLDALAGTSLDGLLLCATHTHSGPGGYWDNWFAELAAMGGYDEAWAGALAARLADAVRAALARLAPATIRVAEGDGGGFARNRRFEDGAVDRALRFALVEAADDGAPIAALVGFGAHPTILGPGSLLLSAEFPGAARAVVERELGAPALLLNGASGDLAPEVPGGGADPAAVRRTGEDLAHRILDLRARLSAPEGGPLGVAERRVSLPSPNTRPAAGPVLRVLFDPIARSFAPAETLVQAIRVGPLSLAAFPCDVGSSVGMALRGRFPGVTLVLVSYANDYAGYCVDEETWRRGGYEAAMSFYGPGFAGSLLDAVADAIEATASR